ncbi:MAG TPA: MbtH family NRPS accessory protein [Mycobacteriales bacterium]|nr:MbtH family NRPS accessory protein [Mycobacteriales bacterium]
MTNPFEHDDSVYLVLINADNQHSLWPASIDVPAGWTVGHGPAARQECLDYVDTHWTDLRPASLAAG